MAARAASGWSEPASDERVVERLAMLAGAAVVLFVAGVSALHVLRRDLNPATRTLSEYAVGRYGSLMVICFVALGAGALALASALALARGTSPVSGLVLTLLAVFGVGTLVCAGFRTDLDVPQATVTLVGRVHDLAATTALFCGVAALPAAAAAWRDDPRWRRLGAASVILAVVAVVGLPVLGGAAGFGLGERLVVGVLVSWQLMVARRLGRLDRGPSADPARR